MKKIIFEANTVGPNDRIVITGRSQNRAEIILDHSKALWTFEGGLWQPLSGLSAHGCKSWNVEFDSEEKCQLFCDEENRGRRFTDKQKAKPYPKLAGLDRSFHYIDDWNWTNRVWRKMNSEYPALGERISRSLVFRRHYQNINASTRWTEIKRIYHNAVDQDKIPQGFEALISAMKLLIDLKLPFITGQPSRA